MGDQSSMTITEFVQFAKDSNAGLAQLIGRKKDNSPTFAVVAVVGKEQTKELLALLKRMKSVEQ